MRTVLVTGAGGFIGANLVRKLLRDPGLRVVGLDKLTYAGSRESLRGLADHDRFHLVEADICDREAVDATFRGFRPIGLYHLAAESHVDRSIDNPGEFVRTNIVGTYELLQATRRFQAQTGGEPIRFLHVSTDEVYGSLGPDDPAFGEASRYQPNSPYSASKAASDHLVRAWHATYGLDVVVTSCSNNFGPFQHPEKLLPVVVLSCLRGQAIPIYGTGDNVRDWISVEDHCDALELAFRSGRSGGAYNVGANNELTNLQMTRRVCAILDELAPREGGGSHGDRITFVEDRPGHDRRYAIDSSKMQEELGWSARRVFDEELRRTVQWYLDNTWWWQGILERGHSMRRQGLLAFPPDDEA